MARRQHHERAPTHISRTIPRVAATTGTSESRVLRGNYPLSCRAGSVRLSQAASPFMCAQGGGHIVQISTVGAVGTMPTMGLYNSSKWGLEAFSEAMAAEVREFGIRVSLIEPGALDTESAGSSMRFSEPLPVYDGLRSRLFGTAEVPWPSTGESTGGTNPDDAADAIFRHIHDGGDDRLRVLIGDDAPEQVHAALARRRDEYARDPRFPRD